MCVVHSICECIPRYIGYVPHGSAPQYIPCSPRYIIHCPTVYIIVPHGICPHSISTIYTVGDIPWGTIIYTVGNISMFPTVYRVCAPRWFPTVYIMLPTVYRIVSHGICPHSISTVYTVGDIPWGTTAYTVGNIECSPRYIITPN